MVRRSILHLRPIPGHPGPGAGSAACGPEAEDFFQRITPVWEWTPAGAFLDLTGTERLYGRGLDGADHVCRQALGVLPLAAAGSAPTRLAARLASWVAARAGGGALYVKPLQVAVFLKPYPVDFLPGRRSAVVRLRQLGVRTLGDLQIVPRDLLRSVFGNDGHHFADEAWGRNVRSVEPDSAGRTGKGTGGGLIVGVRLARPVSAENVQRALRRGLAVRALTHCPGAPLQHGRWFLTAFWPEGRSHSTSVKGPGHGGWKSWQGLVEVLWRRLPRVRKGLLGLELAAGSAAGASAAQGHLFPEDAADCRLADVMRRFRASPDPRLGPACEDLLQARGTVWYGPGSGNDSPVRGLVDGRSPGQ